MIPLMRVTKTFHLNNSLLGLGVSYWGLGAAMVIFLTFGAIKEIPYALEEAAIIDGCTQFRLFWSIIFPLLRTTVITFTILNTFWFWNDYLMPQLMIGGNNNLLTLQLSMYALFTAEWQQWDVALAGLVLIIIPVVIFFVLSQKKIIEGMTSGSVKG